MKIFFTLLILSFFIQKLCWNLLLLAFVYMNIWAGKKEILSKMNVWLQYNGKVNRLMDCCELVLCSVMWYPKVVRMFCNDTWLCLSKRWWVYFCKQLVLRCTVLHYGRVVWQALFDAVMDLCVWYRWGIWLLGFVNLVVWYICASSVHIIMGIIFAIWH
jgi:hypothetical protein